MSHIHKWFLNFHIADIPNRLVNYYIIGLVFVKDDEDDNTVDGSPSVFLKVADYTHWIKQAFASLQPY